MNVTQCKAGIQTGLNEKTLSKRSSCGITLNGLPIEILENIGRRLSYPNVCNLRLVCRHVYSSISNKTVKKAKDDLYYELTKIEKYNMKQKDINFLNKAIDWGKPSWCYYQFFSTDNKGCIVEHTGKPKYRNFFLRFEFETPDPVSNELFKSGIFLYTGELKNGLVFLEFPNQFIIKKYICYSPELNRIVCLASKYLKVVDGDSNFYSFCVGESFDKVFETFKMINNCTLLTDLVDDMLKKTKNIFLDKGPVKKIQTLSNFLTHLFSKREIDEK